MYYIFFFVLCFVVFLFFFFFSSRRRHTRWPRDWSSDVCSSDLGCGRGAVLLAAARRLPEGHAVGIDLWRRRDQTGNTRAAAERNAVAEGVAGRVDFLDADARAIPLPDSSFDVVVSSLTIHNIPG